MYGCSQHNIYKNTPNSSQKISDTPATVAVSNMFPFKAYKISIVQYSLQFTLPYTHSLLGLTLRPPLR